MNITEKLKSLLRERLGVAYTDEIGEGVARVSSQFAKTRYELSQQAMQGKIDGETFAIQLNDAASKAIADVRPILGKHFDAVVGMDESFMLADPAIAKEIDYTHVSKNALVTPHDAPLIAGDSGIEGLGQESPRTETDSDDACQSAT